MFYWIEVKLKFMLVICLWSLSPIIVAMLSAHATFETRAVYFWELKMESS